MALFHANFFSDVLLKNVSAEVIVPQLAQSQIGVEQGEQKSLKTLWLLHGLTDNETIWLRRTCIEVFAERYGIAVVMPTTDRGWYTDMKHGPKYYTYITEELPRIMRGFFRGMSDKKEDNYIAGLSMGGYGALKIGLKNPQSFAGIAAFSAATNLERIIGNYGEDCKDVFGDVNEAVGSQNDIFTIIDEIKDVSALPSVYQWCGTEDELLFENRAVRDRLFEKGIKVDYSESAGNHSWPYWNMQIEKVLDIWFGK